MHAGFQAFLVVPAGRGRGRDAGAGGMVGGEDEGGRAKCCMHMLVQVGEIGDRITCESSTGTGVTGSVSCTATFELYSAASHVSVALSALTFS